MELVEIVLQGIRGSPELARWSFGNGVSVVPAGDKESLLGRIVLELLAPRREPGLEDLRVAETPGRVGIVVVARDGSRHRMLYDLTSGRRVLQRFDGTQFTSVSADVGEIAQAITAQLGFPQLDILREVFVAQPDDLPSKRPAVTSSSTSVTGVPRTTSAPDGASRKHIVGFEAKSSGPQTLDEVRARIVAIDEMIAVQEQVRTLEFDLDGMQKRGFDLDDTTRPVEAARRIVRDLEADLQQWAALDSYPDDVLERIRKLRTVDDEEARDLKRIDEEFRQMSARHEADTLEVSGGHVRPGTSPLEAALGHRFLKTALLVGVGAIAVGVLGAFTWAPLRWLSLVDIPAFGLALWGALQVLSGLEVAASSKARLARFQAERQQIITRASIDREQRDRLLAQWKLTGDAVDRIDEQKRARAGAIVRVQEAREEVARLEAVPELRRALDEQGANVAAMKRIEAELHRLGAGVVPHVGELLTEKGELVARLNGVASTSTTSGEGAPVATPGADHARRLLELARDLLLVPLDDVMALCRPRASQILLALSDRRYHEVQMSGRGDCAAVDASSSQAIAFAALPPGDRDLLHLSVKLAVIEAAVRKTRMPVIFDRALDAFPESRAPLFARMLQFLGQSTQVIAITTRRELSSAGVVVTAQGA